MKFFLSLSIFAIIFLHWSSPSSGNVLRRVRRDSEFCSQDLDQLVERASSSGKTISNPGGPVVRAVTGAKNRVEFIEAKIAPEHIGNGTPISSDMEQLAKGLGRDDDIGGLVLAEILGGPGNQAWNVFPQSSDMAYKESWAQAEDDIANISKKGNTVNYLALLEYPNDEATRPDSIWWSYSYEDSSGNHCSAGSIFSPGKKIRWGFDF